MMGQKSPQHAAVTGFYGVVINLMQLCAFVGLNCSNFYSRIPFVYHRPGDCLSQQGFMIFLRSYRVYYVGLALDSVRPLPFHPLR
jgi:hypothetical protein